MKEIVTKYLESNYRLSVESLRDYRLYDLKNKKPESLQSIFKLLVKVFGITAEELEVIVNPWMELKAIDLNNRIVEIQSRIYLATGVEIKLTTDQLAELIEEEDSGF